MKLRDSGGLFAKYGPGTQDAQRPDGQWVRVFFNLPISFRRAQKFADAISAGKPIPPTARVRIVDVPPPYQFKHDFSSPPWRPITGAPVGEMHANERYEAKVALASGSVTTGTFRAHVFKGWAWFDPNGRQIEPTHFAVITPAPPRG